MSDTFDHEAEAVDRMLNGEEDDAGFEDNEEWECENCGAIHPKWHKDCWYCKNK